MALPLITTEELQLAYRVLDVIAHQHDPDTLPGLALRSGAEVLRIELRRRTIHDPLPGQLEVS
jgi:hypothetical protein